MAQSDLHVRKPEGLNSVQTCEGGTSSWTVHSAGPGSFCSRELEVGEEWRVCPTCVAHMGWWLEKPPTERAHFLLFLHIPGLALVDITSVSGMERLA